MNSIKLHTAEEFEDSLSSSKRKKHTSVACESCRRLKIRCQGGSDTAAPASPCNHCAKLGRRCLWPEEDFRKRQRTSAIAATGLPAPDTVVSFPSCRSEDHDVSRGERLTPGEIDTRRISTLDGSNQLLGGPGSDFSTDTNPVKGLPAAKRSGIPYTTTQYYRHLGSTAIAPGYKKISLKVRQSDHDTQSTSETTGPNEILPLFDAATDLPATMLLTHLLDAFFEFYGGVFCFLNRLHLEQLTRTGEASSFLICAMSALSSRFCKPEIFAPYFQLPTDGRQRERWEYSLPFIDQTKKLLMPLLSIPSCDVCAGLLFLALAEFGDNNEAGRYGSRRRRKVTKRI